jgi:hypothetical protein
MRNTTEIVQAHPKNRQKDCLGSSLGTKCHLIHCALYRCYLGNTTRGTATIENIRNEMLKIKDEFDTQVELSDSHLGTQNLRAALEVMKRRGITEQPYRGKWRLTDEAIRQIENPTLTDDTFGRKVREKEAMARTKKVFKADDKGRIALAGFAGHMVEVEYLSKNEVRVTKVRIEIVPVTDDE